MHKVIFYPVNNSDTSQILLDNGKRFLFDYRHQKKSEDEGSTDFNLKKHLKEELSKEKRDYFDVVAFTHGDKDHISLSTEFFELRYADKYQGNGRIKINELWVPAAMILETATNDEQSDEFVIWRQEARYRLKEGRGIRVFSKPDKLKAWLEENGLTVESRKHLITDAGQTVPDFKLDSDGVEFFCHSPFIKHVDKGDDLRNDAALIFNVRFKMVDSTYDYLAVGDSTWEVLGDIVEISKSHNNEDRLAWDLYNIPHHCSYLALSDDKGSEETEPKPLVKELLQKGKEGAYLVSSSNPIEDTKAGREQQQPPHIQAKKCYQSYLREVGGSKLLVTMEEPKPSKPEPLVFKIERAGISLDKKIVSAASIITSAPAPRAG
jgi:hypothetical protein